MRSGSNFPTNSNIQSSSTDSQSKPCLHGLAHAKLESEDGCSSKTPQAGPFQIVTPDPTSTTETIMRFDDQNPSYNNTIVSEPDSTYDMAHSEETDIAHFFKRPIQIESLLWSVNGSLDIVFNPWLLWSQNKRVSNRLNNYRNFKGKCCLKVLINGNQFYWGRAMLSYSPTVNSDFVHLHPGAPGFMMASQRPHLLLDPSTSQGGSLCLPFFWEQNAINITDAQAFSQLGQCWLTSLNPLKHAEGTDPVRITIFAWMEDVTLSGPTQTPIAGLTPQAGIVEAGKEYYDSLPGGPVSKPAGIIAAAAMKVSAMCPPIAPYAMATADAAVSVGGLASMFGFSRPAIIAAPNYVRPKGIGNLVNTNQPDCVTRLTFDSKQEVTIDPRTTGLGGVDELSFEYLRKRETYLQAFEWNPSQSAGETVAQLGITPQNYRYGPISPLLTTPAHVHTPLSWMTLPFRYWQGTMRYRFQIVASGYHKGRLKFVWDPVKHSTTPEDNVAYTHIVDIAEERDFSLDIGWGNNMPALELPALRNVDNPHYRPNNSALFDQEFANGVLSVYVLNELVQSGAGTQSIEVNIYVSSPDMEIWAPHEQNIETKTYLYPPVEVFSRKEAQSGTVESDENTSTEVSNPVEAPVLAPMGVTSAPPKLSAILHGDPLTSFRTLMKRYTKHTTIGWAPLVEPNAGTQQLNYYNHSQGAMPYNRGYSASGVDNGYNACQMTMINYVMPAYVGWRGSIRWKIIPKFICNSCIGNIEVRRCGGDCNYNTIWNKGAFATLAGGNPNQQVTEIREYMNLDEGTGFDGMDISIPDINGALEIEIPYYSGQRFQRFVAGLTDIASKGLGFQFRMNFVATDLLAPSYNFYDTQVAIGEDFNAFYFNGVPPMWDVEGPI